MSRARAYRHGAGPVRAAEARTAREARRSAHRRSEVRLVHEAAAAARRRSGDARSRAAAPTALPSSCCSTTWCSSAIRWALGQEPGRRRRRLRQRHLDGAGRLPQGDRRDRRYRQAQRRRGEAGPRQAQGRLQDQGHAEGEVAARDRRHALRRRLRGDGRQQAGLGEGEERRADELRLHPVQLRRRRRRLVVHPRLEADEGRRPLSAARITSSPSARSHSPPEKQAKKGVEVIGKLEKTDFPPGLDVEFDLGRPASRRRTAWSGCARRGRCSRTRTAWRR